MTTNFLKSEPKKIITIRPNGSRRIQIDCSEPQITDQSYKKASDINTIMKQYQKTGLLLEPMKAFSKYVDNTQAIPLEDAHRLLYEAKELFYQLPSALRKQMDNDPVQLESFLSNPENHDQLIKFGLLKPKADDASPSASPQPPAGSPDPKQPE
ncbi:MAG: internal scaffolding protein [Wigfec virus K19_177]|nr:MAG: internal scaffolding protein [Wigfec virus K19_177]